MCDQRKRILTIIFSNILLLIYNRLGDSTIAMCLRVYNYIVLKIAFGNAKMLDYTQWLLITSIYEVPKVF